MRRVKEGLQKAHFLARNVAMFFKSWLFLLILVTQKTKVKSSESVLNKLFHLYKENNILKVILVILNHFVFLPKQRSINKKYVDLYSLWVCITHRAPVQICNAFIKTYNYMYLFL